MASTAATHRRRWSQAEKDICAAGVKKFGAFNHRRIAQLVGTRSKAQVRTYLYAAGYRKLGAAPFYTTVDQPPPPPPPPPATHERLDNTEVPTVDIFNGATDRSDDEGNTNDGVERHQKILRREEQHHVPFWSAAELAADAWTPPQRQAFDRAFARKLAARVAAAEITSVNIVHGHGTVARRLLLRGEVLVDPCASYIEGAPPANDDRAVAYNDAHFRLRSDTRAAPSYYLNEARNTEPNVEWRVIDLGRPALGIIVLRDIQPKEELLLFYEAPD
jgi:hypothetical protein